MAVVTLEQKHIDALKWVSIAQSCEPTRYYLNGIFFNKNGEVVATDGHRLHLFKHSFDIKSENFAGAIVPRNAISAILELWAETKAKEIDLIIFKSGFEVAFPGKVLLRGKTVDGTFPDYPRVIPVSGESTKETIFSVTELKTMLPELSILKQINKQKTIPLGFKGGKQFIRVQILRKNIR